MASKFPYTYRIQSQMNDPSRSMRYSLLLDLFLAYAGDQRHSLLATTKVISQFSKVSRDIQGQKSVNRIVQPLSNIDFSKVYVRRFYKMTWQK